MTDPPRTADTTFASLKDFQRRTVDHALHRLYDAPDSTRRFLVADEVGMGKTLVARGVIAGAIERLQHEPSVGRIDILYICSNADIARQNLAKLDVRGDASKPLNTRITMLARQVRDLDRPSPDGSKTVNLVSFTPGTSFEKGHQGGKVQERALLHYLVAPSFADSSLARRNALGRVLRLRVRREGWQYELQQLEKPENTPDEGITRMFRKKLSGSKLLRTLHRLVDEVTGRRELSKEQLRESSHIVADLRSLLATVSIDALEPDLVILDEFQRFKHLLERPDPGTAEEEVSNLAQQLFDYPAARVLLLSATPYRLFTLPEEKELTGDSHYDDFIATLDFLHRGSPEPMAAIVSGFRDFRRALTAGADPSVARKRTQDLLLEVMCRTERPALGDYDMVSDKNSILASPSADELVGYVALRRIADQVAAPLSFEYWKSAPYFLNFMDGYQLHRRFRDALTETPDVAINLGDAPTIPARTVASRAAIPPANARLDGLVKETIGQGLWELLWLPPSLPYYESSGAFARADHATTTKRLIFSSWAAAPTSIASLLSYEAQRQMLGPVRRDSVDRGQTRPRLRYAVAGDSPQGMTALSLFTPISALADLADPLVLARQHTSAEMLDLEAAIDATAARIEPALPPPGPRSSNLSPETWYWAAPFRMLEDDLTAMFENVITVDEGETQEAGGLAAHLERASGAREEPLGSRPDDLVEWVTKLGLGGPANVAWRGLRRVTTEAPAITNGALLRAATLIAAGFRSLFNRPDVMALLDGRGEASDQRYWQRVLDYCLSGNLQAVMDEYLHHLVGNTSPETDEDLLEMAEQIRAVIALRTAPLRAFDPASVDRPINFNARFAVRYGTARGTTKTDDKSIERLADVQAAFNSPFWPMVLASTSVGQEGVDFHWWCHSLVHWNIPSNPVDFEQREGRVHRFKGHAVRKNVAQVHRADALLSEHPDPWQAAFDAAHAARTDNCTAELGDLWPWWVFPGNAKIERWIPALPFSKDIERDQRLLRLRGLYRLAFGQPRQEELLELFDTDVMASEVHAVRPLDLRPPTNSQ